MVNGNNVVFSTATTSGGTRVPLAHAETVTYATSHAVIDVTTKDSVSNSEFIPGRITKTLSGTNLWDLSTITGSSNSEVLQDYIDNRTEIFFSFGQGTDLYTGSGFFTEVSWDAPTDDKVSGSWSFQVSGAITKSFA